MNETETKPTSLNGTLSLVTSCKRQDVNIKASNPQLRNIPGKLFPPFQCFLSDLEWHVFCSCLEIWEFQKHSEWFDWNWNNNVWKSTNRLSEAHTSLIIFVISVAIFMSGLFSTSVYLWVSCTSLLYDTCQEKQNKKQKKKQFWLKQTKKVSSL